MKFLNFFNNTGDFLIRMTQSSLNKDKVKEIKNKMISGDFDFTKDENKIGYEFLENVYYITEGHHRMQAALEIWKENGNYECVRNLIKNGLKWIIKKKPNSYRFIF